MSDFQLLSHAFAPVLPPHLHATHLSRLTGSPPVRRQLVYLVDVCSQFFLNEFEWVFFQILFKRGENKSFFGLEGTSSSSLASGSHQ